MRLTCPCQPELPLVFLWVLMAIIAYAVKIIIAFLYKFSYELNRALCFYLILSCVTYQIMSACLLNMFDFSQSNQYHTLLTKYYQLVYNKHIVYSILAQLKTLLSPNCFHIQKALRCAYISDVSKVENFKSLSFTSRIQCHSCPISMM